MRLSTSLPWGTGGVTHDHSPTQTPPRALSSRALLRSNKSTEYYRSLRDPYLTSDPTSAIILPKIQRASSKAIAAVRKVSYAASLLLCTEQPAPARRRARHSSDRKTPTGSTTTRSRNIPAEAHSPAAPLLAFPRLSEPPRQHSRGKRTTGKRRAMAADVFAKETRVF